MKDWFKRHLNYTYLLSWLLLYLPMFLVYFVLPLFHLESSTVQTIVKIVGSTYILLFLIPIHIWILREKGWGWYWVFIMDVAPLFFPNVKDKQRKS
jgi:hypothetical protein